MASNQINLPDGFQLDSGDSSVKLPDGFVLDANTVPAEKPSFLDEMVQGIKRDIPEITGATAGGILATPIAAPVAVVNPAAGLGIEMAAQGAGSMVGGALKSAYQEGVNLKDQILGQPFTYPMAPQTPGQAVGEMGKDFATGAGGALIAKPISAAAGVVLKPIANALKPAAVAGADAIKAAFDSVGGKFLPAQITDNAALDFIQNFVQSTFTGSDAIRVFKEGQQKALKYMADNLTEKFTTALNASGAEEAGKLVIGALTDGESAFKAMARTLYNNVDDKIGKASVSTLGLKQAAQEIRDKIAETVQDKTGANILSSKVSGLLDVIDNLKDKIPFTSAHELYSQLGSTAKDLAGSVGSKDSQAVMLYSKLAGIASDQLDKTATSLSGDALSAWNTAQEFYKSGKQIFSNELIAKIADKEPARVGEALFAKGNVEAIQAVKTALQKTGELSNKPQYYDDVFKSLQAGHFEGILKSATDPTTGQLSGAKLLSVLADPKSARTLSEVYSPDQLASLRMLADVASTVESKVGGKGGGVAGALTQVGAAGALFGAINPFVDNNHRGSLALSGISVLLAPYAMAHLMTNPTGAKLLAEGLNSAFGQTASAAVKSGTDLGAKSIGNIISFLIKNKMLASQESPTSAKQ